MPLPRGICNLLYPTGKASACVKPRNSWKGYILYLFPYIFVYSFAFVDTDENFSTKYCISWLVGPQQTFEKANICQSGFELGGLHCTHIYVRVEMSLIYFVVVYALHCGCWKPSVTRSTCRFLGHFDGSWRKLIYASPCKKKKKAGFH